MNSVLFVTYDSYPGNNANIQCVRILMKYFSGHGCNVHIACLKEPAQRPDEMTSADGIRVHYLPEVLHAIRRTPDQECRFTPVAAAAKAVRYSVRNLQRLSLHDLSFGFDNPLLRQKLGRIIEEQKINTVITVSAPYITHLCYLKIRRRYPQVRWIVYELDPFAYNHFLPEGQISKRRALEEKVCMEADQIISSMGISEENERHAFRREYRDKTICTALPNFVDGSEAAGWRFDHDRINLVYTGTFYKGLRSPSAFLEMLAKIPPDLLRFHVFGYGCEEEFARYPDLRDTVVCHGPSSRETCDAALAGADVLVSFGNDCMNQIPSKIFSYFNSGKPILHLYSCLEPVTKMLENHPLHLCIENCASGAVEKAAAIERFCKETAGRKMTLEDLAKLKEKYGSEQVCKTILEASCRK